MRLKQLKSEEGKALSKIILILVFIHLFGFSYSHPFSFAHVTDTHVGGSTGAEDLARTVADINSLPDIDFVLVTGDITEFGSGEELRTAKSILDRLQKPYYMVPGNHDSKWSESGCNDFVRIFGSETFHFEKNGIIFIGTASGPNMRMGPGLVPREQLLFLDSVLSHLQNPDQPIVFVNHYPIDESLINSNKILNLFKNKNLQVSLLGHGHANKLYNFQGIPGIMGRSNLRASKETGGYNIGTFRNDTLFYAERIPFKMTLPVWCKMPIGEKSGLQVKAEAEAMTEAEAKAEAKVIWSFTEPSDIGAGIATRGRFCIYTTTNGRIIARDRRDGSFLWEFKTGGRSILRHLSKGTG
jgi:predicted MPP superfamily phosphohydrolase